VPARRLPSERLALFAVVVAVVVAVAALASPLRARPPVSAEAPAPSSPRLVLVISVDQMKAEYLTRFHDLYQAGLRRLVDHGAVFTHAYYRHACTETGPGHSVILSGRSPRSSGIVANAWYDRALHRTVNVVEDETVRVLGGKGRAASPAHFNGFTLGDLLKARSPSSRVVGISFKDRAAILMAGPRADGAYWYESETGRFVTSSYYTREIPDWLEAWNAKRLPDSYAGRLWERLRPDPGLYLRYAGPDDVQGEWDGKDNVFPHDIRGKPPEFEYYDDLRRTPFADEILLDAALAAMEAHGLGQHDATDLLAISFSANDVVGHTYGGDSQEVLDLQLRLDRTLGRLLDEVDRRVGPGRTLVVLTADHGAMPLVEVLKSRGIDARRASTGDLHAPVLNALARRFPGATGLVAAVDPPDYWLDLEAIQRQGLKRADVEDTIREALLGTGLVEAVYTQAELVGEPPAHDRYFPLHQRAFFAPRSADLVGRVKEYTYLGGYRGGTGHGTPYEYDRHVPIIFMAPGIAPGPRDAECGPEDIAWALGRLIGVDYPKQDAETDLLPLLRAH
jgi:predicted AlkP superfamily pyrophosphatase or phosphodiesterase